MRRILFVDDEPRILDGLQRMLRSQRREWDMRFAIGPQAALAELAAAPFDVVVTDMRMPGMDGAALLAEVKQLYPATIRLILSGYSDPEAAARATQVAHQFLSKPCSADMLREAVQRAGNLKDEASSDEVGAVVGGIDSLPPLPDVYQRISQMLSAPDPSIRSIVEVLEQDVGISAKLLQLVNSSFFGNGRRVATVRGAVDLLGIQMVQNLVLSTEVFRTFRIRGEIKGFSADDLSTHSLRVAALARQMGTGRETAETAHSIGLLHDIGKLVLIDRIPDRYEAAIRTAVETGAPLHAVERDELGVTHAEVGGYLLGLWNLPEVIVRAVADHHCPEEVTDSLEPRDLVRVANALVHEADNAALPNRPTNVLGDLSVLENPEIRERLPAWRSLLSDQTDETL